MFLIKMSAMKINPNASAIYLWIMVVGKYGSMDRLRRRTTPLITVSGRTDAPMITFREDISPGIRKKNIDVAVHDLPPEANICALLALTFLRGSQKSKRLSDFKIPKEFCDSITTMDLKECKLTIE